MATTIEKKDDYINGDIFEYGLNNTLLSTSKNMFLFICDANGEILAASDIIGGTALPENVKIKFTGEVDENGGGVLTIKDISDKDTKTYVVSEEGTKAEFFALSGWSATTTEEADGVTREFPDLEGGTSQDLYLVGHLENNPIINSSTKFQFDEANINFSI